MSVEKQDVHIVCVWPVSHRENGIHLLTSVRSYDDTHQPGSLAPVMGKVDDCDRDQIESYEFCAARRELCEELDDPQIHTLYKYRSEIVVDDESERVMYHIFFALCPEEAPLAPNRQTGELSETRWMSYTAINDAIDDPDILTYSRLRVMLPDDEAEIMQFLLEHE